ncbi:hypothetical protein OIU84_002711 [Salix udensis]|uniref:C3H1-type domain-containing protein n=1 Tax=Salix udensis TaxID=889485 RepID=A0AAD6P517_9ROSI|nr:hypothetical protein OIU84_002711 [Salix udensis]
MAAAPITADTGAGNCNTTTNNNRNSGVADFLAGRRSFRQTVCRHWLRSLWSRIAFTSTPMKISRRAICEYKLGFCPNGPDCRYRHAKLPGPPPQMEKNCNAFTSRNIKMGIDLGRLSAPKSL